MNISFDLDDTLILHPQDRQTHTGERLLFTGEYLRRGATALLRDLSVRHQLYIYTSSTRTRVRLHISFLMKRIRIRRVINAFVHERILESYAFEKPPTKLPSHFGMDLHIDDSPEVVEEGCVHGFDVLRIDPDDRNWVTVIRRYLGEEDSDAEPEVDNEPIDTSIYS